MWNCANAGWIDEFSAMNMEYCPAQLQMNQLNLRIIPQINKEKPKDVNMQLVGIGNTRVLIDYV
jgi:hypothetical protein